MKMFVFDVIFKEKAHQIVTSNLRSLGVKTRIKKNASKTEKVERNGNSLKKVFRTSLSYLPMEVVTLSSGGVVHVPVFVSQAAMFLLKDVGHEGIFRKAGSQLRQRELISRLDAGGELGEKNSVIDVANCLKSFFRYLPEPLIPYAYHDLFVRCGMLKTYRSEALLLACLLLPTSNLYTLAFFMEFLKLVSSNEKQNKMGADNLAKVIGPNIMPLQETTMIAMQSRLEAHLSIVKFLIDNADKIGILPGHIADAISAELSLSVENELNSSDSLLAAKNKKKKHRSGSLTRMFSGLKKIVGKNNLSNDLDVHDQPVFISDPHHLYTPLTKVGKKRKVADVTTATSVKKQHDLVEVEYVDKSHGYQHFFISSKFRTSNPVKDRCPIMTSRIQKGLPVHPEIKSDKSDRSKKIRLSLDRLRGRTGKHSDIEKIIESDNEDSESSPYIERRWSGDGQILGMDLNETAKRRRTRSVSAAFPPSPRRDLKPLNFAYGDVLMDADINLSDDERVEVKNKRKHPDSLKAISEEYVKIPKSEYEEIKNRVIAIESQISREFETVTKTSDEPMVNTVNDVQSEYEKTLEEANIANTASTDILARRLSKELKIRKSAEHKVIRSPSARRIGSLRRRSQEKPKIQRQGVTRTSSWHVTDRSPKVNTSPQIKTPVLNNSSAKCNLKRGRPLVQRDGQRESRNDLQSFCSEETNARLHCLQEQLNTLICQTAELTEDCDDSLEDEVSHPVESKISVSVRRTSSFHGNDFIDNSQYFNNKVRELKKTNAQQSVGIEVEDPEMRTPDSRKEKTVTWKDADDFFQMEEKMRTPVPQTGRASVAKLRAQNAGMVLAKAKLFDENKRGVNGQEFDKNRRQSIPVNRVNKSKNLKYSDDDVPSVRKTTSVRRKICTPSPRNSNVKSKTKNSPSPVALPASPIRNKADRLPCQKENKNLNYSSLTQNSATVHETNVNIYKPEDSPLKTPHIKKSLGVKTPKSAKNLVRRPPVSVRRTPLKATVPVTPKRQSPRNVIKTMHSNRNMTSTPRN